jgi:MSHA biogenesis protein MshK
MDEIMKRRIGMALLLAAGMVPAMAQNLADPTQPPAGAGQPLSSAAGGALDMAPVSKGPQLQSILIASNGRAVAVIDGQTVRLGGKIDGALLVKVGKNQVVLQRGREMQVLTLFPGIEPDHTPASVSSQKK